VRAPIRIIVASRLRGLACVASGFHPRRLNRRHRSDDATPHTGVAAVALPLPWQRIGLLLCFLCLLIGCQAFAQTGDKYPGEFAEIRATFAFTDRDGANIDISYLDTGGSGDTAFVLLHGFGASAFTWHAILPSLAECHRVIALDLKGFGESGKPDDGRYSVFDQAEIVDALIVRLRLRQVILGGHSMGGTIALALASDPPGERDYAVCRLILFAAAAFRQRLPLFIMALDIPVIGEIALRVLPPTTTTRLVLEAGYYNDDLITRDDIEAYARGLESPGGRRALTDAASALADLNESGYTFDFDKIRVPVLVIWGKHDTVVPSGYAFALRDALPGPVSFHMLSECGHISPTEQPQEILGLIKEFLSND